MIKINMGCGWRNFGTDWIHIDSGDYEHLDYSSITNLEQFKDNSVDLIYASHVIEYFDREEVKNVLLEWQRVLVTSGVLRLSVPDFRQIAHLYLNKTYDLHKFLGPLYGKMTMGKETIYHKTVYDLHSLSSLLYDLNFKNIHLYDWRRTDHANFDDHSQAYLPHMDKENGKLLSLNLECIK
jgi:predicted SAM-dependent methyltransferase